MMKFKEYIKIESDDSINQVMSGDWISKSRSAWKAVDDEDNTIEIHNDLKIAKSCCNKDQKVIKVPNTNVFKIVAPILLSRGISRIISDKNF